MKLLIVEDDLTISDFICKGFREQGYVVDHVVDGRDALMMAQEQHYDAAVVDLMLPGMDGLQLIQTLRREGSRLPILILSAKHTVDDRVKGLETGSDDYLVKPFSFVELQARVQALLRRQPQSGEHSLLQLADLTLDRISKQVKRGDKVISLQPRELSLLEYMLQYPSKVLSKTMILEQVWEYQFDPKTNVVDVLVCRLRGKIDKGFEPKLLHTLRGVGYVLKAPE